MSIENAPPQAEREPASPVAPHTAAPRAAAALQRHKRRTRRLQLWYYPIVAVLVLAAAGFAAVVMSRGEVAHAHLHIAAKPAPTVADAEPAAQQNLAWTSSDSLASGVPFAGGTVITYSAHTVTGRDATTGAAVWTYTRTDLSICQVIQQGGKTFAFFVRDGNCDEINAFDTGTGARAAVQGTLDSNGQPTNGIPIFASNQYTLLLTTKEQVHAIDPSTGYDRWNTPAQSGCSDVQSALGSNGVLISQDCKDGHYLELRDAYAQDQINDLPNPKLLLWRIKTSTALVPVSADQLISALDPATGQLFSYDAKGKVAHSTTLGPLPGGTASVTSTTSADVELLWAAGTGYGVSTTTGQRLWKVALTGPPTFGAHVLVAATSDGLAALDGDTGTIGTVYSIPPPPAGAAVYPVGAGFVVGRGPSSGPVATSVYR